MVHLARAVASTRPTRPSASADFGHTDPQYVLPYGGTMTIDGPARRLTAHY